MRSLSLSLQPIRLRSSVVLYPGAFLASISEGFLNLGIVFFLRERYGARPGLIGVFMGYSMLVYILGCLLLRPVFERLRSQTSLLLAVTGMPLSLLLLVLLPSLPLTFLFSGLYRLAMAFFWPPAMGWLSQGVEDAALSRRQSRFNLSWSLGLVIGYVLAGMASRQAARLPLLLSIASYAAYALYLGSALALFPSLRAEAQANPLPDHVPPPASRPAPSGKGTPLRFPAWVGMFPNYLVSGMVAAVFPLFAQDVLGASKSLVGTLVSMRSLTQSLGFLLLGAVGFWHYKGRYLVAAQVYLAVLIVLMSLARSVAFFAVLFPLLGLSSAMSYTGGLFHAIAGAGRRAGRMAIHESVLNTGYITGASVCGLLYQQYSMRAVVLFCLGSSLLALLVQGILLARFRRTAARLRQ
jgi:MFS family permease